MLNSPLQRKKNLIYQVPSSCVRSIFIYVPFFLFPVLHPVSVSCRSSSCYLVASNVNDTQIPAVFLSQEVILEKLSCVCFNELMPSISEFLLCFTALHQNYRWRESSMWVCLPLNMDCSFISLTKSWIPVNFLPHRRAALAQLCGVGGGT